MSEKIKQKLEALRPLADGAVEQVNLGLPVKVLREILKWDLEQSQPHRSPSGLFRELCLIGYDTLSTERTSPLGRAGGLYPTLRLPRILSQEKGEDGKAPESATTVNAVIHAILTRHAVEATGEIVEAIPLALVNLLKAGGPLANVNTNTNTNTNTNNTNTVVTK